MPLEAPMAKSSETPKRKANPALLKPVQPDATLAVVVGSTPIPRSEVTKKLWDYIKKHKLQDEKKKTNINADDALTAVFGGKKQVTMFEMTKLVSQHIK
jgi:chromatin remodeling complex protein RSC6